MMEDHKKLWYELWEYLPNKSNLTEVELMRFIELYNLYLGYKRDKWITDVDKMYALHVKWQSDSYSMDEMEADKQHVEDTIARNRARLRAIREWKESRK